MFKSIALISVACCLFAAAVFASPMKEDESVKTGMSDAYRRGIARFGNGQEESDKGYVQEHQSLKNKIFSQYTKGLQALGGGKPTLADQYRKHSFVPLAPSVLPAQHPYVPNGRLTPDAAAKIYVPHRPYQFTNDRMW